MAESNIASTVERNKRVTVELEPELVEAIGLVVECDKLKGRPIKLTTKNACKNLIRWGLEWWALHAVDLLYGDRELTEDELDRIRGPFSDDIHELHYLLLEDEKRTTGYRDDFVRDLLEKRPELSNVDIALRVSRTSGACNTKAVKLDKMAEIVAKLRSAVRPVRPTSRNE
jgi:hypothetical protein